MCSQGLAVLEEKPAGEPLEEQKAQIPSPTQTDQEHMSYNKDPSMQLSLFLCKLKVKYLLPLLIHWIICLSLGC